MSSLPDSPPAATAVAAAAAVAASATAADAHAASPELGPYAYPRWSWMRKKFSRIIAFGFGSGLVRPASGTWGTLAAWLIWELLAMNDRSPWTIGIGLVAAFGIGVWACERCGRETGMPDHRGMVWDEMVAFWLVLWLIPSSIGAQALGFALFRFFDIVKPQPIRYFDRKLGGGFGVMWDDILAAFYVLLIFAAFTRLTA